MVGVRRDHPRTRGEKDSAIYNLENMTGSPPHARGKVHNNTGLSSGEGDHPRTRGEKEHQIVRGIDEVGSPPHARGKVFIYAYVFEGCRITPARAGKS